MKHDLVLLTGATSGIGKALFSLIDSPVIAVSRNQHELHKLSAHRAIASDLSTTLGREEVIAAIWEEKPDLIINNAGFGLYGDALQLSMQEQMKIIELNCQALLELTIEGAKAMKEAGKQGVIMNISSIVSLLPSPQMSVYGASKAFVTHLSKSLDFEWKRHGIRVLASLPGQVATPFSTKAAKKEVKPTSSQAISVEKMAKRILWQIERKKKIDIYDWRYATLAFLSKYFLPDALFASNIEKSIKERLN